ncbi:Mu transposase C-terminal domain-containing protein [Burkholderia multivorans]|uniref:Mu transposase C-terminal domain-containing protein n=1 Tax=Burkholderia multivorans TaxID=87883 RepID=UPI00075AFEBF|nr:DDE-type integrase/transposase/recombinase [Burkholderia multivorans]KVR40736.1 integrase [Burkholderia multivorans]
MLSKSQLGELFERLGTPPAGRKLITNARLHAPVRDVTSRGGNVITVLASQKMARDIRTESRHIEFAVAVTKEHAKDVLEYYAQPCELRLHLIDEATGEVKKIQHFPDYLTIGSDGFTLEEWKSEARLLRLAEKYPYRYVRSSDGQWCSPQIEKQLADLGVRYRVCSEDCIPRRRVENLLDLADYFLPSAEPLPPESVGRLNAALADEGALSFFELLDAPYGFSADFLNQVIAQNLVATALDQEPLADKRAFFLYRDAALRDLLITNRRPGQIPDAESFSLEIAAGSRFLFDAQELTMALVGEESIVCSRQDGTNVELTRDWVQLALERNEIAAVQNEGTTSGKDVSRYSQAELETALRRQTILDSINAEGHVSSRTLRRWTARRLVALANGDNAALALVPNNAAKGNRTPRLTQTQVRRMDDVIDIAWRSSNAINYRTCYQHMVVAFNGTGEKAPSYPTMIARIKARKTNADVRTRCGKRTAYQEAPFIDVLYYDSPVHGSRPFQYVHIDHTELDIELKSSRTGHPLGRPWLTLAIDAWSRRIVAFYLTFDPPSYRSVMMVVRDMVRRFNRLPEFIIVDNGRDFMTLAFQTFLRVMGTHLRFRPAGQPRHGAVLERLFGKLNTEYIHNLAGNTKATKNVRTVTGSHLPKKLAQWTLRSLYQGLQRWACEYYDQEMHPALGESPREAFRRGVRENGHRPQRHIAFNRDFLIATCPPVDRSGVRTVNPQRGVKVDNRFYWNANFKLPNVSGESLPTREDPWDASSVYVLLKDGWVTAICRSLHGLGQLTEIEKRALTAEYNARIKLPADDEQHAQRLREFLRVFKPEGALALELERQSENKDLYNTLQMSNIEPIAAPRRFAPAGEPLDGRGTLPHQDYPDGAPPRQEFDVGGAALAILDDFDEF